MSVFSIVMLIYFIDSRCFCYPVRSAEPMYVLVPLSELYNRYPYINPSILVQKNEELKTDTKITPSTIEDDAAATIQKNVIPINVQFPVNRGVLSNSPAPQLPPNAVRGPIGDIIMALPFFPIEINVPDAIMAIYHGISSIAMSIAQRIPFINRFGNPEATGPFNIYGTPTGLSGLPAPGNIRFGGGPFLDHFLQSFGNQGQSEQNPWEFHQPDPLQLQKILPFPGPYNMPKAQFHYRY